MYTSTLNVVKTDFRQRLILATHGKTDFTSFSIRNGIADGLPTEVILRTIREQAADNYNTLAKVIGEVLLNDIIAAHNNTL